MYKKQVCVVFCLNRGDKKCNYRCFPILNFELSCLKRFKFPRLLFAVCFRDVFQIRIMNYLRAIDNLVSFFRLSGFWPP